MTIFKLKTIDKYISGSLVQPFITGISASVIIMVANILFFYLKMISEANIPADIVFRFFIYHLPSIVVVAFPMGFLFSTLITLGRLSRDNEITALNACGVSFNRLITPVLFMSLLVSGLGFFINEKVVPFANTQRNNLYVDILNNPKVMPVKERVFLNTKEGRYFYVEKVDKEKGLYNDVMIFDNNKTNLTAKNTYPRVINAESARRKDGKWLLYKGSLKNYDKDGHVSYESTFNEMELSFKLDKNNFAFNDASTDSLDMKGSAKQLKELKKKGIDTKSKEIEYQLKMSIPLATFFVTLIAAPIGIRFAKKGTYFGASICIVLVFFWHFTHTYAVAFGNQGTIHPLIAAWIQNIIFAVAGIFLIFKTNEN